MQTRNMNDTAITLAIGSEVGFIDSEVELLCKQGFFITLGERILRVEHAIPAILGKLYLKLGFNEDKVIVS